MPKMTTSEYAAFRGIGDAAVRKAIKMKHRLPGVIKMEKFGKVHVLHVNKTKVPKNLRVTK